jgi:hypothetical protein
MTVYREYSVFLNAATPDEIPQIGDTLKVVNMENMEDKWRGGYILVTLAPVEEECRTLDEIHGEYNYE